MSATQLDKLMASQKKMYGNEDMKPFCIKKKKFKPLTDRVRRSQILSIVFGFWCIPNQDDLRLPVPPSDQAARGGVQKYVRIPASSRPTQMLE
ncbi:hypothetical protein PoB_003343400 [Plakobranchus ocellatus]|uniref:Uncharacterized protein n=1 Tax=Plakobranchus ocellatus TaxID=259542 RepID=A0AAV4AL31_9GAST|nr:hypothetical protein PoB_003343400 [Plakobranchus ocellatus]